MKKKEFQRAGVDLCINLFHFMHLSKKLQAVFFPPGFWVELKKCGNN
jgi:hypothetical protein